MKDGIDPQGPAAEQLQRMRAGQNPAPPTAADPAERIARALETMVVLQQERIRLQIAEAAFAQNAVTVMAGRIEAVRDVVRDGFRDLAKAQADAVHQAETMANQAQSATTDVLQTLLKGMNDKPEVRVSPGAGHVQIDPGTAVD